MKYRGTPVVNALRSKFDMTDDKDIAAWELLNEINQTPIKDLIKEFVNQLMTDLTEIEAQLLTFERLRLKHLKDKVLRTQLAVTVALLRKERDELRTVIGSETYQRVAPVLREGSVSQGSGTGTRITKSAKLKQKTMGHKAGSSDNRRSEDVTG